MKNFLKPTWKKIILVIFFGIIFSLSPFVCHKYAERTALTQEVELQEFGPIELPPQITECGLPLNYLKAKTSPLCVLCPSDFSVNNVPNLIINLLSWYLFSCLMIWVWKRIKRHKSK